MTQNPADIDKHGLSGDFEENQAIDRIQLVEQ